MFQSPSEALQAVQRVSEAEHERLRQLRQKGEIFYDPNPNDLFVWQLTVRERDRGFYTHTFTRLFVVRELGVRWVVENYKPRFLEWPSGYVVDEDHLKLYQEGKYEEIYNYWNEHGLVCCTLETVCLSTSVSSV